MRLLVASLLLLCAAGTAAEQSAPLRKAVAPDTWPTWALVPGTTVHRELPGTAKFGVLENATRQQALLNEVERTGYPHFPGHGAGRDKSWDPEESIFIIGIPKIHAQNLGRAFGQIAIVVKELGCPAEPILCS